MTGPHAGPAWRVAAVYLLLTLLVSGLLAFDRGLWQDDAALLAAVAIRPAGLLGRLVHPMGSPTRLLLGAPYALALASGAPLLFLQLLGVLAWLGIGVAASLVAGRLFPDSRKASFAAGALTLCASSDFLTGSTVALGYDLSILAFLGALYALLRWHDEPRGGLLAGACLLLAASLFTTDAAAPAALLTPLLLAWRDGLPVRRRVRGAIALWWGVMLPYVLVLLRALLDPRQYLASAFVPLAAPERALRLGKLFAWNFAPWMWAFRRRVWFPAPAPALSLALRLSLGLLGLVAFLWGLRAARNPGAGPGGPLARRASGSMSGACLVLAFASNAAFAFVVFADVCYRTHLLSRVFASIALAGVAAGLAAARPGLRALVWAVPALFVGLGVVGGLERQDFFLGSTRAQRVELGSLLDEVPRLSPEAFLVLHVPPGTPTFRSTQVSYLAESWVTLLYDRPDSRVFVWDEEKGSRCRGEAEALVCTGVGRPAPLTVPYARLVLMSFSGASGRYRLEPAIPAALKPGPGAGAYRPSALVAAAPRTPLARELLGRSTPLSRLLPPPPAPARGGG